MAKENRKSNQYMSLVREVKKGNECAFNKLSKMCKPHIEIVAHNLLRSNGDSGIAFEELTAIGYESLYLAALKIREDSLGFISYLIQTLHTNMVSYIKSNSYQYSASMFNGLSFSSNTECGDDGLTNAELIGISDKYHRYEIFNDLIKEFSIPGKYSKHEKEVIIYLIEGFGPEEISKKIKRPTYSVYAYIKNAHKKLNNSPLKSRYYNL